MRVARPINKWYNDDENRIARQRQGVTSPPPPAAGDAPPEAAETLHRRDIIPISPPQGKRIFRTARDYYGLCSAFLFPHIFYYTRRQKTMKKRKQNLPRPAVHRMELWWAALPTVPGHVQRGTRPVVIVSNDLGNASSPVVSVVPCTTQRHKPALPTHVYLRGYGLSSGSIAMCEQVMPLDKSCLLRHIGTVYGWYDRLAIQHALATQLGIDLCINLAA